MTAAEYKIIKIILNEIDISFSYKGKSKLGSVKSYIYKINFLINALISMLIVKVHVLLRREISLKVICLKSNVQTVIICNNFRHDYEWIYM